MHNLAPVCLLVGLAIFVNCVSIYWFVRVQTRTVRQRAQMAQRSRRPPKNRSQQITVKLLFSQAGYTSPVIVFYLVMLVSGIVGYEIGRVLVHLHPLLAAVLAIIGAYLPIWYLRGKRRARQRQFVQQLPGALELMANALRAGIGITSAFEVVAKETPAPLGFEFSQLVTSMTLGGGGLEQALNMMVEHNPSTDLRLFAQAVIINKQVGGNLAEVLDNLDRTIRERTWLQRELESATAEQQLSAWILGLLPVVVAVVIMIIMPTYVQPLIKTFVGRCIVATAFVLQVAGVLIMRSILQVINY